MDGLEFTLIAIPFVFLFLGYIFKQIKIKAAHNWPMTMAVVEQTCVDEVNRWYFRSNLPDYFGGILYSYHVNGEFYSGQHNFSDSYSSPENALSSVNKWRGKKIMVRYRHDDPATSIFLEDDPRPPRDRR